MRVGRLRAPNTALQLTASRARSVVFCRLLPARLRQLNASPLCRLVVASITAMDYTREADVEYRTYK
jgi:hypothetical protein